MVSKKHKNVCKVWKCIEYSLILVSAITGCASVSAFVSLAGIPISVASFLVELKNCAITAWIKTYKTVIKKKF